MISGYSSVRNPFLRSKKEIKSSDTKRKSTETIVQLVQDEDFIPIVPKDETDIDRVSSTDNNDKTFLSGIVESIDENEFEDRLIKGAEETGLFGLLVNSLGIRMVENVDCMRLNLNCVIY